MKFIFRRMCKNLPIKSASSKLAAAVMQIFFMHQNMFPYYQLELDQVNCAISGMFIFEILTHGAHQTQGAHKAHGANQTHGAQQTHV